MIEYTETCNYNKMERTEAFFIEVREIRTTIYKTQEN